MVCVKPYGISDVLLMRKTHVKPYDEIPSYVNQAKIVIAYSFTYSLGTRDSSVTSRVINSSIDQLVWLSPSTPTSQIGKADLQKKIWTINNLGPFSFVARIVMRDYTTITKS